LARCAGWLQKPAAAAARVPAAVEVLGGRRRGKFVATNHTSATVKVTGVWVLWLCADFPTGLAVKEGVGENEGGVG
jgi:hypothetical protein